MPLLQEPHERPSVAQAGSGIVVVVVLVVVVLVVLVVLTVGKSPTKAATVSSTSASTAATSPVVKQPPFASAFAKPRVKALVALARQVPLGVRPRESAFW